MNQLVKIAKLIFSISIVLFNSAYSQQISIPSKLVNIEISGVVKSKASGDLLQNVNVVIIDYLQGTVTDEDGKFQLNASVKLPVTIELSFIGYQSQRVLIKKRRTTGLKVNLKEEVKLGEEIVVSASKVEERIALAPITISSIGIQSLKSTPSVDAYNSIVNLKGVQANTGSLTFTSINTRGFADMQNWRFVQLVDQVDINAPGLGYGVGGNYGLVDLDIEQIELVPGANSALYGANAFNGLLNISSKSPFEYKGLSASVKRGVTSQDAGGANPLFDFAFRFADSSEDDKIAFKLSFNYFTGTDWTANDESFYISPERASRANLLLQTPRTSPNFDAVNIYGDEVQAQVLLENGGQPVPINRTGIKESDLVDYDINTYKVNGALFYKLTDNITASYNFMYVNGDAILRHTAVYPLVNFKLQNHVARVEASNWNLNITHTQEDANNSYALLATGAFIEQGRKSNEAWGNDYSQAFINGVPGEATAGSHEDARRYADRDMPAVGSPEFQALRTATLENPDITTGGSEFIDRTRLFTVQGKYKFDQLNETVNLQIGGDYKRYSLDSEGQLFNDGNLGFGEPIPVNTFGFYYQLGKKIADERIDIRTSLRYDKHQDFKGRITPRISGVFSLDREKKQNIRVSYQTGFRNPAPQEGYIALDISQAVVLGGIQNNIENYSVRTANGSVVDGQTIYNNLITAASFRRFLESGGTNSGVLERSDLSFLRQERNSTFEIGYNYVFRNRLFFDLSYYTTNYRDFVVRNSAFSPEAQRVFLVYSNIEENVRSKGITTELTYWPGRGYEFGINYTRTTFDADEAIENNQEFFPGFNTPRNRVNLSVSNRNIGESDFGFDLKYRSWSSYTWQSPFGQGEIEGKAVVDLSLFKTISHLKSVVKFGANNLFNNEYRTVYGGPDVGAIYYISWTYDAGLIP